MLTRSHPFAQETPSERVDDESLTRGPRRWQALALVCVAFFMTVLDVSIVNVALPSIKTVVRRLRPEAAVGANRYTITFGGFLLLGGPRADLLGRGACS